MSDVPRSCMKAGRARIHFHEDANRITVGQPNRPARGSRARLTGRYIRLLRVAGVPAGKRGEVTAQLAVLNVGLREYELHSLPQTIGRSPLEGRLFIKPNRPLGKAYSGASLGDVLRRVVLV